MSAHALCRTIKYTPIFFLQEVDLKPVTVNFILVGTPLLLALCSIIAGRVSKVVGELACSCLLPLAYALACH